MALSYFLNRKKTTCVVSFKGSLTTNDVEALDQCAKETLAEPAKYIILNMAGLRDVEATVSRPFTLFQQGLRGKARLFVCGLQDEPSKILKAEGVLRESELAVDLMGCLQVILNLEKG